MESYLVDEAVLDQFADALIKEKYPNDPAGTHADLKKTLMVKADHQILKTLIGNLTAEQGAELEKLLDENDTDPAVFDAFFEKHGINLQEIFKDAMLKFKDDFLKGDKNA